MTARAQGGERDGRVDNVGLLRLLLAAFVVLAHAPQLVDGNRSRELLTQAFGTICLGEFAVDGFFLVSGFLVTGSLRRSRTFGDYLLKRALRIVPGFVAASLVCVLLFAPLAGGHLTPGVLAQAAARTVVLATPYVPGAFAGLPYPELNSAVWTIPCEVACYLLLGLVAIGGLLRHPRHYALLLAALATALAARWLAWPPAEEISLLNGLTLALRLPLLFGCGSLAWLWRARIRLDARLAGLAACLLALGLNWRPLVEPAVALCGGYLALWFALGLRPTRLSRAVNRTDVSYGLYLYAWPVTNLVILAHPACSPWLAAAVTLAAAGTLGWLSWHLVERPVLAWRSDASRAGSAFMTRAAT